MKYLLTIVCTTYNHKNFIKQVLDGFLIQKTNFAFQIIIHDDASNDGTQEIIKEYEKKFPKLIKSIIQKENQFKTDRLYSSFMDICANITSKYMTICEGDDYWLDPYKLQKQVDFLEANPDYSISTHAVKQIHQDGTPSIVKPFSKMKIIKNYLSISLEDVRKNFALIYFARTCANVFRWDKDLIKNLENEIFASDRYMQLLFLQKGKMAYTDDVMAVYRKHSGGLTSGMLKTNSWYLNHGFAYANFFHLIHKFFDINKLAKRDKLAIKTMKIALENNRKDIIEKFQYIVPKIYDDILKANIEYKRIENKNCEVVKIPLLCSEFLSNKKKVIIWACGNDGKTLQFMLRNEGIRTVAFGDNNKSLHNTFHDNTPIYSIDIIKEKYGNTYPIIISNPLRLYDIYWDLLEHGFNKDNLIAIY